MLASQNGKASGCSVGIATCRPSAFISDTAICVRKAKTGSM